MSLDQVANFVKVTLFQGCGPTDTTLQLVTGSGSKLPNPANGAFNAVWWNATDYIDPADDPNVEIVRVTALSGDTLTVVRAQEGTAATQKQNVNKIYKLLLGITAKTVADLSKGPPVNVATTWQNTLVDSGDHQHFSAPSPITSVYGLYLQNGQRYNSSLFTVSGSQVVLNSPDPDAAAIGLELVYS